MRIEQCVCMHAMDAGSSSETEICLACGGVAVVRKRRVLGNGTKEVTLLWKEILVNAMEEEGKELDITNFFSQKERFMCKNCFYAYNKVIEKKEVHSLTQIFLAISYSCHL